MAFQLKTFADIYGAVREELGLQASDSLSINKIKRLVNQVYLNEIVPYSQWKWLRGQVAIVKENAYRAGTCAVNEGSRAVTLTIAPAQSLKGYWFSTNNYKERYKIAAHQGGSTAVVLETEYTGVTAPTGSYVIWSDAIPLPSNCRETFEVQQDFQQGSLRSMGLQKFRQTVSINPKSEGRPSLYSTSDYKDPEPYEAISGLPSLSTRSSNSLVRTLVFSSNIEALVAAGERIKISGAGQSAYNGEFVISSVSGSQIQFTGTLNFNEAAAADNALVVERQREYNNNAKYRELLVYPAICDRKVNLHIDYIKEVEPLEDDEDEPLIPIEDRQVLYYGTLMIAWRTIGRDPQEAATNANLYDRKLSKMQGKADDSTDMPILRPGRQYLRTKRANNRMRTAGQIENNFGGFSGGGGGGASAIKGEAGKLAKFSEIDNSLTSSDVVANDILSVDNVKTVTGKTISGNNNTITDLLHGSQVDSPSSGVHGVTGSVVGTTDTQTLTNKTIDADTNTLSNIRDAEIALDAAIVGTKIVPDFGAQNIENSGSVTTTALVLNDTGSEATTIETANTVSASYTVKLPADPAASPGEAIVVTDITGSEIETTWGAAGDASWQMQNAGSGQIRFKAGSRAVNGIVTDIALDITTNATVVALTDDTLTVVDASNGFLYAASDTVRIYTFYDIINEDFAAIGNSTDDSKWDYRNEDPDFDINLSRYVPIGYVDVTATASPGDVTVNITNFPVGPWTTFALQDALEEQVVLDLGGDFSSGTLTINRIGQIVVAQISTANHSSSATPQSAVALIPARFRPEQTTFNAVATISTTADADFNISNTGTFNIAYKNLSTGAAVARTSLPLAATITWRIADANYIPNSKRLAVAFPSINDLVDTKVLSSGVVTDTNGTIADLTSTKFNAGDVVDITIQARITNVNADTVSQFQIFNGSTQIGDIRLGASSTSGTVVGSPSTTIKGVVLETGTVTVVSDSFTDGSSYTGTGNTQGTFLQVQKVPVAGIGVLLPTLNSRVHLDSANGYGSTNTKIRRWTNLRENIGDAITYTDSSTLGATFTINKTGMYSIYRWDASSSGGWRAGLSVNSNQLTTNIESIDFNDFLSLVDFAQNTTGPISVTKRFQVGDVIRAHDASVLNATTRVTSGIIVEHVGF